MTEIAPRWTVDTETGCWEWAGTKSDGYGIIRRGDRRYVVHRVIYEDRKGPVPGGLELDHLCRNRGCVNPDHLEPVTTAENHRRGGQAKLTAATVAEIRASSEMNRDLAARFGVDPSLISRVRSRERWK